MGQAQGTCRGSQVSYQKACSLSLEGLHLTLHHTTQLLCLLGQVAYLGLIVLFLLQNGGSNGY